MAAIRTYSPTSPSVLRSLKAGQRVAVVIPARDEAATVGAVVSGVRDLGDLIDEIVVVDDGSADDTAGVAASAGASVVPARGEGKGAALGYGLGATTSEIVLFCDADVSPFFPSLISGLLGPLLSHSEIDLVKATYARPLSGRPNEGGRVTELTARPALAAYFPSLAGLGQPLAGEWGGRRSILERLRFPDGYGVDVGVLIDVMRWRGVRAIAEVDLGERAHRNRPLRELAPMAEEVLRTILGRAGVLHQRSASTDLTPLMASDRARPA